jgi:hypothetical protein
VTNEECIFPKIGSVWKHNNTHNIYRVTDIVNKLSDRPDKYPVLIVYQRLKDSSKWSRKVELWNSSFTLVLNAGWEDDYADDPDNYDFHINKLEGKVKTLLLEVDTYIQRDIDYIRRSGFDEKWDFPTVFRVLLASYLENDSPNPLLDK